MNTNRWVASVFFFFGYGLYVAIPHGRSLLKPANHQTLTVLASFSLGLVSLLVSNDILRNDGKNSYKVITNTLKYNCIEHKILYWGALCGLIPVLFLELFMPDFSLISNPNQQGVAQVIGEILATIFAITASFTLLSIEFFSNKLSPRAIAPLVRSKFILLVVATYVVSIPVLLYSDYFVGPDTGSKMAFLILIWALSCLLSYGVYFVRRLSSTGQVSLIKSQIPDQFLDEIVRKIEDGTVSLRDSNDRFIDIQNFALQAAGDKNIFEFVQWIEVLHEMERQYVKSLHSKRDSSEDDRKDVYDKIRSVHSYFSFLHQQILSEIIENDDRRFLRPYSQIFIERVRYAVEIQAERSADSLLDDLIDVFPTVIKSNSSLSQFQKPVSDLLDELVEQAVENHAKNHPYRGISSSDRSDKEIREGLWGRNVHSLLISLLGFFKGVAIECTNENKRDSVRFVTRQYNNSIEHLIEVNGNVELRIDYSHHLMEAYYDIYNSASESGDKILPISLELIAPEYTTGSSFMRNDQIEVFLGILDKYEEFTIKKIEADNDDNRIRDHLRTDLFHIAPQHPKIASRLINIVISCIEADTQEQPKQLQTLSVILDYYGDELTPEMIFMMEEVMREYNYERPSY